MKKWAKTCSRATSTSPSGSEVTTTRHVTTNNNHITHDFQLFHFFVAIEDVSPAVHGKERSALLESFKESWSTLCALSDGKTPFRDNVVEAQNYVQSIERILLHGLNFDLVVNGHVIDFIYFITIFDGAPSVDYMLLPRSLNHRERTRAWIRLKLNEHTLAKAFSSLVSLDPEVLGVYYKPWAFVMSSSDASAAVAQLEASEANASVSFELDPEDPKVFHVQSSIPGFSLVTKEPPVKVVVSKKKKKKRVTTVAITSEDGDDDTSGSVNGANRRIKKRQQKKGVLCQSSGPFVASSYKEKMPSQHHGSHNSYHHSANVRFGPCEDDMAESLDPTLLIKVPSLSASSHVADSLHNSVSEPSIDGFEDDEMMVVSVCNDNTPRLQEEPGEKTLSGSICGSDLFKPPVGHPDAAAKEPQEKPLPTLSDDGLVVATNKYSNDGKKQGKKPSHDDENLKKNAPLEDVSSPSGKEESGDGAAVVNKSHVLSANITISDSGVDDVSSSDFSPAMDLPSEPFPKNNRSSCDLNGGSSNSIDVGSGGGDIIEGNDSDNDADNEGGDEDLNSIFTMHVKEAIVIPDYENSDKKCTLYMIAKNRADRAKEKGTEKKRLGVSRGGGNSNNGGGGGDDGSGDGDNDEDDEFLGSKSIAPDGWKAELGELNYYVFTQPPRPFETECYRCKMAFSSSIFDSPRFCDFTGHYFCSKCHSGRRFYIPGRIVWNWDLAQYPVNNASWDYLRENFEVPLINVQAVNPGLYESVPVLKDLQFLRKKLFYMKDYIRCCTKISPHDKAKVLFDTVQKYYYKTPDLYSMKDLVRLNDLVDDLMQILDVWLCHIRSCQLCLNLGSYCEICQSKKPIYMFQIRDVVQCKKCHGIFHKACFKKEFCPKCKRKQTRLIINS